MICVAVLEKKDLLTGLIHAAVFTGQLLQCQGVILQLGFAFLKDSLFHLSLCDGRFKAGAFAVELEYAQEPVFAEYHPDDTYKQDRGEDGSSTLGPELDPSSYP